MNVSVIVPIYNVQNFIAHCAHSLLSQTLESVEYIFVDDCSPDNSMDILRDVLGQYPHRQEQVKLIVHEVNQGLPATRNSGLKVATGEYIFHCDSDDFVETDMLKQMYVAAKQQDADIVWADWYLSYACKERYMKQPSFNSPEDALKAMLSGAMKYNVWNKLVRRQLYTDNKIAFPAGYGMGEDMTTLMLFAYAKRVCYLPKAFYHYVKLNENAFSQTYSERHIQELKYNTERVTQFLTNRYGETLEKEIAFFKLDVKYPFLISTQRKHYDIWRTWYCEAHPYLALNNHLSFRAYIVQWFAAKNMFVFVWLYNQIAYQFLYRLLYK
jgi:hypothetical protein BACCOPRO_03219|uniref:glycosyltransferase family 2 protein n=1 Tax=Bacteroides uniformis TaxID=820 RepID=UPI0040261529